MKNEYTIKEIQNLIFQFKDMNLKEGKLKLLRVLEHEVSLLKEETK